MNATTRLLRAALVPAILAACGCGDSASSPTGPTAATPAAGATVQPSIAGEYTLTFTAAGSCVASLPDEIKQRSYAATITEPASGSVTVALRDADFGWGAAPHAVEITGTRDVDVVRFMIFVGERFDATRELSYSGKAIALSKDNDIAGTFDGSIWLNVAGNLYGDLAGCTASDHAISFVRR